ncbi:peptide-methionine (S)-S-oxide reductase MsrA, partial [uncultured Campylobacter sp.]|uniref:peptide-methionine (S)-S-oxide reductase MsrA n=1 Tax=uncultured Campylobacter sp. TaxID=218934 RepID=UPI00261D2A77
MKIFKALICLFALAAGYLVALNAAGGSSVGAADANFKVKGGGMNANVKEIYLAGGCFWGLEAYFQRIQGVTDAVSGYANGKPAHPSYEEVIQGSGHAETVKVTYDADKLSLNDILQYYFRVVDPTSLNQQGNDRGEQYRSGVYYTDPAEKAVVAEAIAR